MGAGARKNRHCSEGKKKGNLKTLHTGRLGILGPHEDEILQWFVEMRNEGKIVTYRMVGHFVSGVSGLFKRKSVGARQMVVRRFLKRHGVVLRSLTNEAQQTPDTVTGVATDFVDYMRPVLSAKHRAKRYVLNMDQTPIFLNMGNGKTLAVEGSRTVNGLKATSSTVRGAVALTVTSGGHMLSPVLVFKGTPEGGSPIKNFPLFVPAACMNAKSGRGWMSKS